MKKIIAVIGLMMFGMTANAQLWGGSGQSITAVVITNPQYGQDCFVTANGTFPIYSGWYNAYQLKFKLVATYYDVAGNVVGNCNTVIRSAFKSNGAWSYNLTFYANLFYGCPTNASRVAAVIRQEQITSDYWGNVLEDTVTESGLLEDWR